MGIVAKQIYRLARLRRLICVLAVLANFEAAASPTSAQEGAAPVSERELAELRDLSGVAVSPNGSYAVVRVDQPDIDSNRMDLAWYRVSLSTPTQPTRIADGGGPTWNVNGGLEDENPVWSGDSVWFYFRALHDEEMQVWRARADGSLVEQVTQDAANVRSFQLDAELGRLYYVVGPTRYEIKHAEQAEYDSGVLLDESLIPGYPIARTFPVDGRLSMFRHIHGNKEGGSRAALLADRPERIFVIDVASKEVRSATEDDITDYRRLAARATHAPWQSLSKIVAPDGKAAVRIEGMPSVDTTHAGVSRLQYEASGVTSSPVTCIDPVCTGSAMRLKLMGWSDEKTVIFTSSDLSGQGIYAWDVAINRIRKVKLTTGVMGIDRYGQGVCPMTRDFAICVSSAAGQPPRLEAVALHTGRTTVLFDPNPTMTADRLGSTERLHITDELGDEAAAFLVMPRGERHARRWPLVITSYTCSGFLRGGSGDDVPEHVLAGIGIASVCLEDNAGAKRAPHQNGVAIETAYGDMSVALRKAVIAMLDEQRRLIDPRRVAVSGLSAGSTQTLYAISHSNLFAAAIITTPGYDDPTETYFYGATDLARKRVEAGQSQFPYLDPDYWKQFSPAMNAATIHAPVLMLLSDTEYLRAMELFSRMRDIRSPVEMVIYPDEYHLKHQPRHRLAVYEKSVAWMRFWLQGWEDGLKEHEIQYDRWRRMRAAPNTATQ